MYEGDRSRKETLVEPGFRLPSAMDNRPLRFEEFIEQRQPGRVHVGDPGPFEIEQSQRGRPANRAADGSGRPRGHHQTDEGTDRRSDGGDPEEDREGPADPGHNAHEEDGRGPHRLPARDGPAGPIPPRRNRHRSAIEILGDLRLGEFDVLVGINLLREGLDLPEVSLVAILDADKEGYLRSQTSLIQTIGRTARNVEGQVVMYADKVTDSMSDAIDETHRRRKIQLEYNGSTASSRRRSART